MKKHVGCLCQIIPPFIIDELKKAGVAIPTNTRTISREFRERRADQLALRSSQSALVTPPTKNADRFVYDSNTTQHQRLLLVRKEGGAATVDPIVNTVYENAGIIREYYKTAFNYLSVDNHGADLILNVHFGQNYANAFWDGDEMTFGDGDGEVFINLANALDVAGHELTHGVVQYTAGLTYQGQPGALNEHYADVFGSVIKQVSKKQTAATADWLIGDEIMGPSLQGQALRSMKAPGTAYDNPLMGKDPQPDHMNAIYKGTGDNGGVHINSGIPNKVFFLVATGIETDKAALLWFETLKTLKPTTNFKSFKTAILKQAKKLAVAKRVPADTETVVKESFLAVGL
ncbi:M4 family metallopeptidase [Spirosoma utsteinense]|uniref:Neutral metalloproteinase n=1 Tax=Spirosoma utsteinense TaxID=2585773 RepID=A0ABR6WBJ2_9BACT|nr:M4 family metallopeptidase [Spirosoma utsteinense]MBC3786422.1 Zn-dependent metalloprotease [Spirosoma utsteinense]MBC3793868.1 Zn-dependent metalloprotease [Spirosoma utsteinense]